MHIRIPEARFRPFSVKQLTSVIKLLHNALAFATYRKLFIVITPCFRTLKYNNFGEKIGGVRIQKGVRKTCFRTLKNNYMLSQ